MAGTAIVCGGSIGGLFAANALRRAGWRVDLYERASVELAGRGAGIVTHPELIEALEALEADTKDLGVEVSERVAFAQDGSRVRAMPYRQVVTSWDRIYQILRQKLPDAHHHLDRAVTGYRQLGDGAEVRFADGAIARADVVVGADGFRSAIRAQMLPEVTPAYAGYVVWRALADEGDVDPDIFGAFGFFVPDGTQIIGYPIAGPKNDLRRGHRRYNFVWYSAVPPHSLEDMLTDATGKRHGVSIPPPLVRDDVLAEMGKAARESLPKPFTDMLERGERPFFTPIYDHLSPVMAAGCVALAGDAACVARPHVGMGVTKAALDALALAGHLSEAPVERALAAYSAERVPAARQAFERGQLLGRYIFDTGGGNSDGRSNPRRDEIMELTAVFAGQARSSS